MNSKLYGYLAGRCSTHGAKEFQHMGHRCVCAVTGELMYIRKKVKRRLRRKARRKGWYQDDILSEY